MNSKTLIVSIFCFTILAVCNTEVPAKKDCITKEGRLVADGKAFRDDCNTCRCNDGRALCTKKNV